MLRLLSTFPQRSTSNTAACIAARGMHTVAMRCTSSLCLRCAKVYVDNWVSQVSQVLHEGVIYRHIILTVHGDVPHDLLPERRGVVERVDALWGVLSPSSIFGAKSKNRVSEIQRSTDCQTLAKRTLRQNPKSSMQERLHPPPHETACKGICVGKAMACEKNV